MLVVRVARERPGERRVRRERVPQLQRVVGAARHERAVVEPDDVRDGAAVAAADDEGRVLLPHVVDVRPARRKAGWVRGALAVRSRASGRGWETGARRGRWEIGAGSSRGMRVRTCSRRTRRRTSARSARSARCRRWPSSGASTRSRATRRAKASPCGRPSPRRCTAGRRSRSRWTRRGTSAPRAVGPSGWWRRPTPPPSPRSRSRRAASARRGSSRCTRACCGRRSPRRRSGRRCAGPRRGRTRMS